MKTDNNINGSYSRNNVQCTSMKIDQCNCTHNLPDDIPAFHLLHKIIKYCLNLVPSLSGWSLVSADVTVKEHCRWRAATMIDSS